MVEVGDEAESECLHETLKIPMEQGTATSLYKNDGISADEAQSKRCKVTVQHPRRIQSRDKFFDRFWRHVSHRHFV